MAAVPVNVSASVPVKVPSHRKLTGCMASPYVFFPLNLSETVPLNAPASVLVKASASVPLRTSAVLPIKTTAAPVSEQAKLSGNTRLTGSTSDYVFIRYGVADVLKSYDRLDFGLFGCSWVPKASWSVVFAHGVREDNWRDYLTPAKINFMDAGDLLHVIASGTSDGLLCAIDEHGFHRRALHGVRTVVSLKDLKNDARVQSGGCLFLCIGLLSINESGEVRADTDVTFDGQLYWNLYSD